MDILEGYIALDPETQARNISAWTPVVAEVLQGICSWEDAVLQEHVGVLYPIAVDLLARDMSPEVRESLRSGEQSLNIWDLTHTFLSRHHTDSCENRSLPAVFHRIGLCLNIFQLEGSVVSADEDAATNAK